MDLLSLACICLLTGAAGERPEAVPLDTIHIRDPFILPVPEEKKYYLFGTHASAAVDFPVYVSGDLKTWEGPMMAFSRSPEFWADRDFWAPEVHRYQGRYYMFASFKAEDVRRGTQILVSDAPQGPYRPHSNGPVTPRDWECLDGTLFVDAAGQPWIVFCHEWVQTYDGEICVLRLTPKLDAAAGDPVLLFRASSAPWATVIGFGKSPKGIVTDGPFLHRMQNGTLIMLWSSMSKLLYAQGVARSESASITGPWKQDPEPLFKDDGGHGMIFRTLDGRLMLTLHQPNAGGKERARLFSLEEKDGALIYAPWPK